MRTDAVQRVLEAELVAARERRHGADPLVLDVGGGSGVWAVPLAAAGCLVTVIDSSPNALATLRRRAEEAGVAGRIAAVQGDADALTEVVPDEGVDLVLGHGVLEVVDDAEAAVAALAAAACAGGAVSVLVANRYAAVLGRAMAGRLGDARRLLDDPSGRVGAHDPVLRRFDAEGLAELVGGAGLTVEVLQGHGVLHDLVPGAVLEAPGAAEALADLELAAATRSPLRDVASRLHALGRRGSA
ncbi:Methyltransferase domain-containing protein [Streptoalloteichus tenebrarius]|uniref:Methyltransferase domain-containing protein n=1 Tax=Streptoalloteichus tenebrarius (strain ATCC 17920 / DSM 40477 / JCM 4838 / CBS 697.72 / NBRC 16177 / NCIMB 11028 / NRRL B-12390 / A12253. 1 / ISP 5477) TaxID=1933 RepID=A0ABT1HN78_STRSD|nr:class I SAM-dependent methyltransferase [Streptoalloteichus tenebrarius]MCP2256948.1 Methyltransferase domain-containing protein [Streptoalloteichus tenebrarius]BFF00140.1 methyltransferase domain-containing protein [Streptoalloteichus tenebrarius]